MKIDFSTHPLLSLAGRTTMQFWLQIALQLATFLALKIILDFSDPEWARQVNGPMLKVTLMFFASFLTLIAHLLFLLVRTIMHYKRNKQPASSIKRKFQKSLVVFFTLLMNLVVFMVLVNLGGQHDALPACFKDFGQETKL